MSYYKKKTFSRNQTTPCPHKKRCHWFFRRNFYKYWRIFIIVRAHNFTRECQSHWRENFLPYIRYVATIPCESLRHKSNTFHTILGLCTCLYRSHLGEPVSMKQTKQQKVRGSKFMFKMSTIHGNTCIQTTVPLRNRCRDDGVHGPAASTPSADVLSTPSHHGSASGRPSLDAVVHRIQIWIRLKLDSNLAN